MPLYPEPHSPEWFKALKAFDPRQAAASEKIVRLAGRKDVCSVCGDDPAADHKLVEQDLSPNAVGSIRLGGGCRSIRTKMHAENYVPLDK